MNRQDQRPKLATAFLKPVVICLMDRHTHGTRTAHASHKQTRVVAKYFQDRPNASIRSKEDRKFCDASIACNQFIVQWFSKRSFYSFLCVPASWLVVQWLTYICCGSLAPSLPKSGLTFTYTQVTYSHTHRQIRFSEIKSYSSSSKAGFNLRRSPHSCSRVLHIV